jgi:PAS domain S-box-containing protein
MWERAGSHVAIAVRESGELLDQERDRMRLVLSGMRQTVAGGRKLIADTRAMIAVADALANTSYYRRQETIEATSPSASAGPGNPLVKASPKIQVAALPKGPIAARAPFEREALAGHNLMPDPDTLLRLQQISALPIHEGENGRVYERLLDAAISLMSADMGSMQVFHPERGELRLLTERGFHPESASYWQWVRLDSGSTCGMALSAGCRVVVPDIKTCGAMVGTGDLGAYCRSGIRAVQSTPLVARSGRLLGMISTHWRKPHRPTERELLPLDVLARQAADLIERNEVEAALRESREQLQWLAAIVQSSNDAILSANLDGIITSWNAGAERLYGYSAEEAIGKPITILTPGEHQDEEFAIIGRVRRGDHIERYETVRRRRDGTLLDVLLTVSPVRDTEGNVVGASKIARDITERKAHEHYIHLLTREVNHRAKNMLNVVGAMARQTANKNPEDFVQRFEKRIQALSAGYDLLIRNEWKGVDVKDLVRAQLAHFASLIDSRIAVRGPRLRLKPESAQAIGLALHELATNAGKYGALSTNKGRVDIWWQAAANMFTISWTENEGPPVAAPTRRGFGSTVIDTMAKYSVGGEVAIYYARSGLMWQLTCRAANALELSSSL